MDNFTANLETGLTITIVGMASVLIFLTIMIWAMHLMGHILNLINKYFPEEIKEEVPKKEKKNDEEEIAVAIAAVMARERG